MKTPPPLALMLPLALLWTGGFIGLVIASRAFPGLSEIVKSGKTLHALGIWVWVYLMTSSVAQLKGRRGWPWYLFGLFTMWGSYLGLVAVGAVVNLPLLQSGQRVAAVNNIAVFMLAGFPVGYLATALLSAWLRRSEPVSRAPANRDPSSDPDLFEQQDLLEPDCDVVFQRFCAPHYTPEELASRHYPGTRPDLEEAGEERLGAEAASRAAAELDGIRARVQREWPGLYGVQLPMGIGWVQAFDDYYDPAMAVEVLQLSEAEATSETCLMLCIEFALVLADTLTQECPALDWLHEEPFWESALVHPSGYRINVFHWAVKKFSGYGCEDGYSAKVQACLGTLGPE